MDNIILDTNRYVMAVIGWHGKILMVKRRIEKEDAKILAQWLIERSNNEQC